MTGIPVLHRGRLQFSRKLDSRQLVKRFSRSYNKQEDSPLFKTIPPELRNQIFEYACQSAPCTDEPYPRNAYYFRPGYECPQRIYTALLCTCRLVYLEARLLPVQLNEHVFWCDNGPPGLYACDPESYFGIDRFTEEQLDVIRNVHLFAPMEWLKTRFDSLCRSPGITTNTLHITMRFNIFLSWFYHFTDPSRHSDFKCWHGNQPLMFTEEWLTSLRLIPRLQTFVLELETMESKKDEICAIADRLKRRIINLQGGQLLTTQGNPVVKGQWIGPSAFEGGMTFVKDENLWRPSLPKTAVTETALTYCTVMVTWTQSWRYA